MPYNDASRGWIKGQPFRFIRGHNARRADAPSRHELFWVWKSMLQRCENPNYEGYARYGGRGISVCERWHSFDAFVYDMGTRPANHSIDRIDNDGNYEPSNCRWATSSQQCANTSSTRRYVMHDGEEICLREMARRLAIAPKSLLRILAGQPQKKPWQDYRRVARMHASGMNQSEIARALGTHQSSIWYALKRAKEEEISRAV